MNRWKGDIMRSEAPRLGSEENGIPFKRVIAEEEQQKYKTRGKWTQKRCKHRRLGKLECFHTDHIGNVASAVSIREGEDEQVENS